MDAEFLGMIGLLFWLAIVVFHMAWLRMIVSNTARSALANEKAAAWLQHLGQGGGQK